MAEIVWIPAFAGMTGVESGNDGGKSEMAARQSSIKLDAKARGRKGREEMENGGASIVHFVLMSTRH